ncbi:MAG TPA: ATP-binding protein [Ktedonobacteraceae bacterium]|nr:ATP-binding protein [Ktedonobacteraceae bacterium]
MAMFVNRIPELTTIEEHFNMFFNQKERLAGYTPILDFYGVKGIGKTSLLHKFSQKLVETNTRYIEAEFHRDASVLARRLQAQAQKYMPVASAENETQDAYTQSIHQLQKLLDQGPLVLLLDAIDTNDQQQIDALEKMLRELVGYQTLFVLLTSRHQLHFENERKVRDKLKTYNVEPFSQEHSYIYLKQLDTSLTVEQCQIIFDWTRGYPLAMNKLVEIMHTGLDITDKEGQKHIAQQIADQILMQEQLATIPPAEQEWYQNILYLLTIPRSFNLIILQQLIEHFKPEYKLANSLAYLVLPRKIIQATGIITWKMALAGFAMDEPVRYILQLNLKINQPQRYKELHAFLAQYNWQNAIETTNHERTRYLREYLYHSACSSEPRQLADLLTRTGRNIIEHTQEHPDQLIRLLEEFLQDQELQYILAPHGAILTNLIYEHLTEKMYQFYLEEPQTEQRFDLLNSFFFYTAKNKSIAKKADALLPRLQEILEREDPGRMLHLYERLGRDAVFKEGMGQDFDVLYAIIRQKTNPEG